jgi:ergothioneine biosynthesis protein EgtB
MQDLFSNLREARARTDSLFRIVRPDSLYERPIPERHRIAFYIGHLEAFDFNLLNDQLGAPGSVQPVFDQLFAFGIDPVDGSLPTDRPSDWPSLEEIHGYKTRVREVLDRGLADFATVGERECTRFAELLHVAIEHRLMHAETLAYILHQLPLERKTRQRQPAPAAVPPTRPGMIEIPAGHAVLGLSRSDAGSFGWDNEYESHSVAVPAFAIDEYMITNGDFLAFVDAGCYEDRTLWSAEGWEWKVERGIVHPLFWRRASDGWRYRGMFDEFVLPLDWPVYVSHREASAYARWVGKSLPTEAQWHRAACGTPAGWDRACPSDFGLPQSRPGNFDFRRWDPVPVGAFPENRSAFGVAGLLGNGWEWTSTLFAPFPGFQPFPFYLGYSANFFDGKHYVMKGGSGQTARSMLRPSFRNWFQPNYPYAYSGFRCVAG